MCTCGTDEEHPVFTGKIRLARTYDDHYNATCFAAYLEQTYDLETKVEPLYLYAMTNEEAKSMLKAIFRDDAPDESGDDDE